jgi:hypothetical protein
VQKAQIAADEGALGLPWGPGVQALEGEGGEGRFEGRDPAIARPGVAAAERGDHGAVDRSDAEAGELDVERGHVREADDPAGVLRDGAPVEPVRDA